jgi:tetratricopeptide (TPR) repeat protein
MALRQTPHDAAIVAEPLARKAVDLDDYDANAHIALARILLFQRGDYGEAMAEARRALGLNPSLGLAHSVMGMVLTFSGQPQQGLLYALVRGYTVSCRVVRVPRARRDWGVSWSARMARLSAGP